MACFMLIRLAIALAFFLALAWATARRLDAGQSLELKPEKNALEVAIAAYGPLYLPLLVAHEAGYFAKRGVTVNIGQLSATASAQALFPVKSIFIRAAPRRFTPTSPAPI